MNGYKKVDITLQVLLIILCLAGFFWRDTSPLNFLVALGAVQVISAVVHFVANKRFRQSLNRRIYTGLALFFLLVLVLGVSGTENSFISAGSILIICTPLVAIYYLIICIAELRKKQEPLD